MKPLNPELAGLIHHIELSNAGWRDRAADEMIISVLYLATAPMCPDDIPPAVRAQYGIEFTSDTIQRRTDSLTSRDCTIRTANGNITLAEDFCRSLNARFEEGEAIGADARRVYDTLLVDHGLSEIAAVSWLVFNERFLFPFIVQLGARTYELMSGEQVSLAQATHYEHFVDDCPADKQAKVRAALMQYFTSRHPAVRAYLLKHFNAYFMLQACHLSEASITELADRANGDLRLVVFLDTNLLFSILGIHDNPADETALALQSLIAQLGKRVRVELKVLPDTLDETKRTLASYERRLSGIALSHNLAVVVGEHRDQFDGITNKYFEAVSQAKGRLSARDYFDPYLTNLLDLLRERGIELHNANTDAYGIRQSVIDDILEQQELEKRRRPDHPKSYEVLRHDVVLWHFTNDQRDPRIESPLDARFWISTEDYRFMRFDAHKRRGSSQTVPICVHPTVLIQLLQFWVPRTPEVESAMLDSLLLMLPGRFDVEAEKVTINILKALSRFEDVEDLSQEAISSVLLNRALRQRIGAKTEPDEALEAVRDAIVHQTIAVERERDDALQRLEQERHRRLAAEEAAAHEERTFAEKTRASEGDLTEERQHSSALEDRVTTLEHEIASRDAQAVKRRTWWERAGFSFAAVTGFAGIGILAWELGTQVTSVLSIHVWLARAGLATVGIAMVGAVVLLIGGRVERVGDWSVFRRFRKAARWFFGVLGTILLGLTTTYLGIQLFA